MMLHESYTTPVDTVHFSTLQGTVAMEDAIWDHLHNRLRRSYDGNPDLITLSPIRHHRKVDMNGTAHYIAEIEVRDARTAF